AAGIELFRTEFQFMIASTFPRPDEQQKMYAEVLDAVGDKPVVFRSLDIGGDKVLPYLRSLHEENPALGWRAIRMALDRPALLRTQLRALMRAAQGREVRVMLPMVTDIAELQAARKLIDKEVRHMVLHGYTLPKRLQLGVMIEVPALVWQLDRLLPLVDFVSVGSNDLLQFLFAADRTNLQVAQRFDPVSYPVLRVLEEVARKAREHKVPVTLCGEMAGSPLEAMALVGIGFRSISMAPSSIGPVKAMIRSLDLSAVEKALDEAFTAKVSDIREHLQGFAATHDIEI
ncbi:MAG: putative PEP-binding protein, partial [Pseudomonadota bacterium]